MHLSCLGRMAGASAPLAEALDGVRGATEKGPGLSALLATCPTPNLSGTSQPADCGGGRAQSRPSQGLFLSPVGHGLDPRAAQEAQQPLPPWGTLWAGSQPVREWTQAPGDGAPLGCPAAGLCQPSFARLCPESVDR